MSSTYAGNAASYPANITIPSDGDARDAASVNVALEGLADRTAHLDASRDTLEGQVAALQPQFTSGNGAGTINGGGTSANQKMTLHTSTVTTVVGDVVEVELSGYLSINKGAVAGPMFMTLQLLLNENGGGDTAITHALVSAQWQTVSTTIQVPFCLRGLKTIATAGTLVAKVEATYSGDVTDTGALQEFFSTLKIWR